MLAEKRSRRLNTSEQGYTELRPEKNARTEAKWFHKKAPLYRFVDDGFSITRINFENSYGFSVNGVMFRVKHALQAQNIFRHMIRRAEEIGMLVNSSKTAMLCVSDALSYKADAFFFDDDMLRIGTTSSIKALGMRFSDRPTMDAQVAHLKKSFRMRYWMLRNLKNNGFTEDELVKVYKTMLRPVADYGCVVYHSSLTIEQDKDIERLQNHALKCIFGPGISASKMRERADIVTLRCRREAMADKFALKLSQDPAFTDRFPRKNTRSSSRRTVQAEEFLEFQARCDRLKNSPFYYFRRRLNGKKGKDYGINDRG